MCVCAQPCGCAFDTCLFAGARGHAMQVKGGGGAAGREGESGFCSLVTLSSFSFFLFFYNDVLSFHTGASVFV